MKISSQKSLTIFLIALYIVFSISSVNAFKVSVQAKTPIKGYFWVQRMYPGNDPIDNLKESEYSTSKKYLEANDQIIFIANSLKTIEDVVDSISLVSLYDDKIDNAGQGQCCKRVTYEEFPATVGLTSIIPAIRTTSQGRSLINAAKLSASKAAGGCTRKVNGSANSRSNPLTSPSFPQRLLKKNRSSKLQANYCLLLHVPDEARWRICHENQADIARLQLKIVYSILSKKTGPNSNVIDKFINGAKVGKVEGFGNWNWDHQEKWGGQCQTTYMQSPINIVKSEIKKPEANFNVGMHLTDVHTLIKRNFGEIIVVFLNFGGVLKLTVDNTYLLFTPQYMTFRFPGESVINGQRFDGEIRLHFAELSDQRVKFHLTIENCNNQWINFDNSS